VTGCGATTFTGPWMEGFDIDVLSRGVKCPALLLRGNEQLGGMLPKADGSELASRIADCTIVDVQSAGHLLHWMATETVVRLTMGFLESLPEKAPAEKQS